MTRIFVPPNVSQRLLEERAAREARAMQAISTEDQLAWVEDFNRELACIEPGLKLVWCPDPAPVDAIAAGAKPGRWHVMRPNPGAPISLLPIVMRDGGFRQPDSSVFEELRKSDLWSSVNVEERRRARMRAEDARVRREVREREERAGEALERWRAVSRAQVSMNSSSPWTQNASGARRRGKG